jgi:hypothetical protein
MSIIRLRFKLPFEYELFKEHAERIAKNEDISIF